MSEGVHSVLIEWFVRLVVVDKIKIKSLLENDNHYTLCLHDENTQIKFEKHFYLLGYVNHFDIWLPHKWSKKCVGDYLSFLFMKEIMTITLQQHEMQVIVEQVKWTTTKSMKLVFIQCRWYCVYIGFGRVLFTITSFLINKRLI